jgi:antitoxin (DNA-binding transcriptional repressor) of toxin-antitoxin stability system
LIDLPYAVTYIVMNRPITMRELQKISAEQIDSLAGQTPIQSRGKTVAYLVPVRQPTARSAARSRAMESAAAELQAWKDGWTPEQREIAEQILRERGLADWD